MKNFLTYLILFSLLFSFSKVNAKNFPASNHEVIDYARSLALSVIDTNFRDSWVIAPEHLRKIEENSKLLQKAFNSLGNVKIGSSPKQVRNILNSPNEKRNEDKIWIYGTPDKDGSYNSLTEVFFDENLQSVTGVITFDPKNVVEDIGIKIGDSIEKIIDSYGEPINEKDFIEDSDNKHYLGLYYLYPRSGIGFLIGKEENSNDLLVQGILVFGRS